MWGSAPTPYRAIPGGGKIPGAVTGENAPRGSKRFATLEGDVKESVNSEVGKRVRKQAVFYGMAPRVPEQPRVRGPRKKRWDGVHMARYGAPSGPLSVLIRVGPRMIERMEGAYDEGDAEAAWR